MIVYGGREERIDPADRLGRLQAQVDRLNVGLETHDPVVALLIEWGVLESAVADALSPEIDIESPLLKRFREGARCVGHLFRLSLQRRSREVPLWIDRFCGILSEIAASPLPPRVVARTPEGYAYYALYPESYLEAATRFFQEAGPRKAVCIGLRSIGASLSAVVAAALEGEGCPVQVHTVRPRGHPFDRRLRLSSALEADLRRPSGAHYLIVDEGPGLSGSSITCVAQRLSELGIAEERIAFFPSWEPDPSRFRSKEARARWERHRKYTVPFNLRFLDLSPNRPLRDLSAGRWRSLFYQTESEYPAVHPQHERRKYLASTPERPGERPLFLKFVGLGRYGTSRRSRAERLAAAGFAPEPLDLQRGFLSTPFIQGSPLSKGEIDSDLLQTMARYLAYLSQTFPVSQCRSFDEIIEMVRVNVGEGLGERWTEAVGRLEPFRTCFETARPIAVDGRMLPHEWLRTGSGYIKTDGVDHHDDHFFPGCQDIAWDIAGAAIEFGLTGGEETLLIDRYQSLMDDAALRTRLPFYKIVYLSYRLGYTHLASETLGPDPDGARFKRWVVHYGILLQQELQRLSLIRF
ncbi:MAG: hypothetical protein HY282_07890 [Nitrospirae bacterium]|nr:hypothetical protein [Candidatus Manganitrophaceae bacterium]